MGTVRITKEFRFEGAHALTGYDGKCRNIHGHSYLMYVTVKGRPLKENGNPKNGMALDFSVLKAIVGRSVIDRFDHALILRKGTPLSEELSREYGNVILTGFQPTSENLAAHFAELIERELPENIELYSIRLHETASSYVEWFKEDNI